MRNYIGQQVHTVALCGTCGQKLSNQLHTPSAFIFGYCVNEECEEKGIGLLIERSTMLIVMINPPQYYDLENEKAYPMLSDKDGRQVWPVAKS